MNLTCIINLNLEYRAQTMQINQEININITSMYSNINANIDI